VNFSGATNVTVVVAFAAELAMHTAAEIMHKLSTDFFMSIPFKEICNKLNVTLAGKLCEIKLERCGRPQ